MRRQENLQTVLSLNLVFRTQEAQHGVVQAIILGPRLTSCPSVVQANLMT